ncbi:MAG TPA: putative Ig domain-containing protein [Candidatus Dojkabacteria bacterium]|nr:putative Ig domain-containing protein [Candidatus Dojkabacteria bacterium]
MRYGNKIDNRLLFFIAFLFVSLIPLFVYLFLNPNDKVERGQGTASQAQSNQAVKGVFDISIYPQIIDTPAPSVKAGFKYDYYLKGIDSDTEPSKLLYAIVEGPKWLYINGNHLYGFPSYTDKGTYKIDVNISDGEHSTDKIFYIVVNE